MKTVEQLQRDESLKRHLPKNQTRVFGWRVFIPMFQNEELIENLRLMDGVKIQPNFRERNCDHCGEIFHYFHHGRGARFCSDYCKIRWHRGKRNSGQPPKKRGRPRKTQ